MTQENTTETLDETLRATSDINLSNKATEIEPKPQAIDSVKMKKRRVNKPKPVEMSDIRYLRQNQSLCEINNSTSNLTSSTYCNRDEVIEYENSEQNLLSQRDHLYNSYERGILHVGRPHAVYSVTNYGQLTPRRDSTTAFDHDAQILEAIGRDQGSQDEFQKQTCNDNQTHVPLLIERRKLPDITKITSKHTSIHMAASAEPRSFPNFVFTHKQNSAAYSKEAHVNSPLLTNPQHPQLQRNMQPLQRSKSDRKMDANQILDINDN